MGKVAQKSVKYFIEARLKSSGIVEKPDVVGAVFGQTEGLLGEDLDLRELQERGRIGRIQVEVEKKDGCSRATIQIPSSLDAADTALIAASLETIERVGPTNASIEVEEIRDERVSKREYIKKRAKQLLEDLDYSSGHEEINEEVRREVRTGQLTEFKGFKAGPGVPESDEIVLVEGRADLVNLLEKGVKNAIALGGTSVPARISEAVESRQVTAFLDGDRGGDLILQELREKATVDYVARAPENKEVEELGKEQVYSALRDKQPEKYSETDVEEEIDADRMEVFRDLLGELVGTGAVYFLDSELEVMEKLPVERLEDPGIEECHALVFDGKIDPETVETAERLGADYVAGMETDGYANSSDLELVTRKEVEVEA